MKDDWPSSLDQKIAEGKTDPISDAEKEAVARFMQTYAELFGPGAPRMDAPSASLLPSRSLLERLLRFLGV